MPKNKELTVLEKEKIVFLYESDLTHKQISEEIGCNRSTVTKTLKRIKDSGSTEIVKRSGRKRISTIRDDRDLIQILRKNRMDSAIDLKNKWDVKASTRTIRRRLFDKSFKSYSVKKNQV